MTTKTRDHEALADLFPAPKLSAVAKQQRELRYLSSTLERAEANLAAWRKSGGSLNDFEDYWHTPQCKVERCQLRLSEQMATAKKVANLHGRRDSEGTAKLWKLVAELNKKHEWLTW